MFPLNWNIPFIRKNGSRTTLGAITGDVAGLTETVEDLADDVADNLDIVDISNTFFIKASDDYAARDPHVFKQGKHIFGYATISKESAFGTSQETLGTLKYPPVSNVNSFCATGTDRYLAPSRLGYLWLNAGSGLIYIKVPGGTDTVAKIIFDYVTA